VQAAAPSGELLDQLVALHRDLVAMRTANSNADEQYQFWKLVHGSAPVPVAVALAHFMEGEDLVTMDEIEAENRYLFPSYIKPEPPQKQQRASANDADYTALAPMEEDYDGNPALSQETLEAYALAEDMGRPVTSPSRATDRLFRGQTPCGKIESGGVLACWCRAIGLGGVLACWCPCQN
jgi:hypothetical protein